MPETKNNPDRLLPAHATAERKGVVRRTAEFLKGFSKLHFEFSPINQKPRAVERMHPAMKQAVSESQAGQGTNPELMPLPPKQEEELARIMQERQEQTASHEIPVVDETPDATVIHVDFSQPRK